MRDPRLHHYLFAHRQLPGTLFSEPARTMRLLQDDAGRFLKVLWKKTADHVPRRDRLPFADVRSEYHPATSGSGRPDIAVISLPEPVGATEAFFVALCASPDSAASIPAFCHTLELSEDVATGQPTTVLGAWDDQGTHINRGAGPPPTLEAFLARIVPPPSR